jgi:hypothetical protein
MAEVQIIYSAGRQFYAIPEVRRECGLWLSIEPYPLPVPAEWRRPDSICACIVRGRDYYRIGMFRPMHTDGSEAVNADDPRVSDYAHAAWWTPGLEEAWATAGAMSATMVAARQIENRSRERGEPPPSPLPQEQSPHSGLSRKEAGEGRISGRGAERRKD